MKLSPVLATGLLLIASVSGCFGGHDDDHGDHDEPPMPPVAVLRVLIDGNETLADPVNGTIGAVTGLNITFDASASTGTNVTFAWDMGDGTVFGVLPEVPGGDNSTGNESGDASLLPGPFGGSGSLQEQNQTEENQTMAPENSVVVYAFAEPGNYTVTVYVTDSAGQIAVASMDFTIEAAGPQPGDFFKSENGTFSGTSKNALNACVRTEHPLTIKGTIDGTSVQGSKVKLTLTALSQTQGQGSYTDLYLLQGSTELGSKKGGSTAKTLEVMRTFAAAAHTIAVDVCPIAVGGSYSGTWEVTYVHR